MLLKRLFDFIVALLLLLLLWPLLLLLVVIVRIKLGSPIFFKQTRPGLHAKPFILVKFRTMKDLFDSNGNLLPDADRLTPFGKFLRSSSLDELPELWNVLKGEMSLVGPRPLLMRYLERYDARQARRHEVRPGITGWAQINGRNATTWEARLEQDVWYVDNRSFLLDIKILFITIFRVLRRSGINAPQNATMPEFMGSHSRTPPSQANLP